MVGLIIFILILLVLAYLAFTMLPPPFGLLVGAVLVIILLVVLIEAFAGSGDHFRVGLNAGQGG